MIDKYIIKFCEIIDNVCDSIANIFIKPKKKKNKNVNCPDNRMNFPKE